MRLATHFLLISALCLSVAGCKKSDDEPDNMMGGGGVGAGGTNAGDGGGQAQAGEGGAGGVGSQAGSGGDSGGTAGDGSGGKGSVDAPPAVADLAEKIAGGVCKALLDCVGPAKLANLVGGEDCKSRVKFETLAREFSHLQESIDAKRVTIDDGSIDACATGIGKLGCSIQTEDFPTDCETAIAGNVKVGDPCVISADCEGTAFCQTKSCPSVCAELLKAGAPCMKDEECGSDLICGSAGKCQTPGRAGAECAGTTGNVCALGWNCWNGTQSTAGVCHQNSETLVNDEGDVCEPGSKLCKEGLSCVFDQAAYEALPSKSQFHCEKTVASGAMCHRGQPGQCPAGEFCETDDPTMIVLEGVCKPLPGDGEICAYPGVCKAGFVCVPEGTDSAACRPIHDNGGACKIDDACRSGYCDAGVCKPPPVCD